MTTAYVFPGQGSQTPGMGRAFYDEWATTQDRFDDFDAAVDADLHTLCFGGDGDRLRRTEHTQPAVFAVGAATYAGVADRVGAPDYVAGHSLGHLTAASTAGMLPDGTGVELVRRRGAAMQRAAETDGPGTMVSVLLVDPEVVAEVCERYPSADVAAHNGPRHTVVSGTRDAVARVRTALDDRTRVRFVDLNVGAGFHSPVMESAADTFEGVLDGTPLDPATVPICSDVTGECYTEPAVARRDLAAQITSPIDWVGVVGALADRGVTRYVTFPPAGTLAGLIERIVPGATVVALEAPGDVAEVDPDG